MLSISSFKPDVTKVDNSHFSRSIVSRIARLCSLLVLMIFAISFASMINGSMSIWSVETKISGINRSFAALV